MVSRQDGGGKNFLTTCLWPGGENILEEASSRENKIRDNKGPLFLKDVRPYLTKVVRGLNDFIKGMIPKMNLKTGMCSKHF